MPVLSPLREVGRAWKYRRSLRTPPGWVRYGSLRRLTPLSDSWGFDRGRPIDRRYIERFLELHRGDIRGHVLEIDADRYASRFGGSRVARLDILDVDPSNRGATIIADLGTPGALPSNVFDCIILTQTLQLISEVRSAIATVVSALSPGGVALITVPGLSPTPASGAGGPFHWCFTEAGMRALLQPFSRIVDATTASHGNLLAATAFLYGLADHELRAAELDHVDPAFPVTVTARLVKLPAQAS